MSTSSYSYPGIRYSYLVLNCAYETMFTLSTVSLNTYATAFWAPSLDEPMNEAFCVLPVWRLPPLPYAWDMTPDFLAPPELVQRVFPTKEAP